MKTALSLVPRRVFRSVMLRHGAIRGYCQVPFASLEEVVTLPSRCDKHNGVHVDLGQYDGPPSETFSSILKASLIQWLAEKRSAAWLRVPIQRSSLISEAAKLGFRYHHAEDTSAMLYIWLRRSSPCKVHPYATHQVGVAGCIYNADTSEVLVVRDRNQVYSLWKFPGGVSELGEDIGETAKREIFEETGLRTEFNGVLAFRQQHNQPGTFGRSDLFFVCHMTPLSFDLTPCKDEIAACQWVPLTELEHCEDLTAMTKQIVLLLRRTLENGLGDVLIECREHPAVYRGRRMSVYSRFVENHDDMNNYVHDVADAPHDILS